MLLKDSYVCKRNIFRNRWAIGGPLEKEEVRQQLWDGWLAALQGKAQTRESGSQAKGTDGEGGGRVLRLSS